MNTLAKIAGGLGLLLIVIFSGAIGKFVGGWSSDQFIEGKRDAELDAVLMQTASELNKLLPMMVDSETRLDSSVGFGKGFRYNYTLVNYSAEDLDATLLEERLRPNIVNNVCTSQDMKVFVENRVPVSYAYYGSAGKQVTVIVVEPSECNDS